MGRLHFRYREGGRRPGRAGLLELWERTQDRGGNVQPPKGGVGSGGTEREGKPDEGSLSPPQSGDSRADPQALGGALERCEPTGKGNWSPEVCKGLFGSSVRLLTALIEELLLSPAWAPAATPGAAAVESYLGEAEETGERKFSTI